MSRPSPLSLRLLHRLRRAGSAAAAMLASALVLASLLGVLHAVGHPAERLLAQTTRVPADSDGAGQAATAQKAALASGTVAAAAWFDVMFSHQANDRDCLIFDQLCHGPAAPAAVLLVLSFALPTAAALITRQGEAIVRWSAFFDARGPPQRT